MENDETNYEAPDEEYLDPGDTKWYSEFQFPENKGSIIFFNGYNHRVALPFDFDQDYIARCIDDLYTDFDFLGVESLEGVVATPNDHNEFRKLVAQYFYEHLLNRMHELFGQLAAEAVSHALENLRAEKKLGKKEEEQYLKDKRKLTEEIKRVMREGPAFGRGRRSRSGTYRSKSELEAAIKTIIEEFEKEFKREPSEKEIRQKLRHHKPPRKTDEDWKPVTLRTINNNIRELEVDLKAVIEKHRQSGNKGK